MFMFSNRHSLIQRVGIKETCVKHSTIFRLYLSQRTQILFFIYLQGEMFLFFTHSVPIPPPFTLPLRVAIR
jgi:hypothetical protein